MNNNLDELITYDITQAAIAELKSKCLALKVTSFTDKEGYLKCKEAKADIKARRVAIEKRRKELKEDSLAFGRKVDAKAREYTQELEAMEAHLQAQQDIIDDEIERRRQEAEFKKQQLVNERIQKLTAVQAECPPNIGELADEMFDAMLHAATVAYEEKKQAEEAEKKRIADMEAENQRLRKEAEEREQAARAEREKHEAEVRKLKAEAEAKEREENEKKRKEAEAKQAEAEKIAAEERAKAQKAEEERAEIERKEKAAKDAALAAKKLEEEKAKKAIEDENLFNEIKNTFPTLELCWVEIARLRKLIKK